MSSAALRPPSIPSAISSPMSPDLEELLLFVVFEDVTEFLEVPDVVTVEVLLVVSLAFSELLSFLFEQDASITEQAARLMSPQSNFFIIDYPFCKYIAKTI